jgi:hypothetical protein
MKLSLFVRILITLTLVTAAAILYVWFIVRPTYEASVLAERLTVIQQLQKSSIVNLDQTISTWSRVSQFTASQVQERPKEGELILQSMMTLHPEIMHMRIFSTGLTDELTSQSTAYPTVHFELKDYQWVHSKNDTTLRVAWLSQKDSTTHLFATQTQFHVQQIPFVLTIVWDANQLNTIFSELPFDKNHAVYIYSPTGIVLHNASSLSLDETYKLADTLHAVQYIQGETDSWHVLTYTFHSAYFWMAVVVPEKVLAQPVENFLLFSITLIVGLMLVMVILGWVLQRQTKKFIEKMKTFLLTAGEQ